MIDLNAYYRVLHPDWSGETLPEFTGNDVKMMAVVETITPPQHEYIDRLVQKDRMEYNIKDSDIVTPLHKLEALTLYTDAQVVVANTATDNISNLLNDPGSFDLLLKSSFSKMLQLTRLLCVSSRINTISEYRQCRLHQFWDVYFNSVSNGSRHRRDALTDGIKIWLLDYQGIADNINTLIRVGAVDQSQILQRVDNLVTVRDI